MSPSPLSEILVDADAPAEEAHLNLHLAPGWSAADTATLPPPIDPARLFAGPEIAIGLIGAEANDVVELPIRSRDPELKKKPCSGEAG